MVERADGRTPLFPISLDIRDEMLRDIRERLMKWTMFSATWTLKTETYYGKPIHYTGITFVGSPQHVFWGGYIEPFLENGIKNGFAKLEQVCRDKHLDPTEYLPELHPLFQQVIGFIYHEMDMIDAQLMYACRRSDKNYTRQPPPVVVADKIRSMNLYLDEHFKAAMHRGHPKPKETTSGIEPSSNLSPANNLTKSASNLKYDKASGQFSLGDKPFQLPNDTYQYKTLKFILKRDIGFFISQDKIHDSFGDGKETDPATQRNRVYDAVRKINIRPKKLLGPGEELLTWKNNGVVRNF